MVSNPLFQEPVYPSREETDTEQAEQPNHRQSASDGAKPQEVRSPRPARRRTRPKRSTSSVGQVDRGEGDAGAHSPAPSTAATSAGSAGSTHSTGLANSAGSPGSPGSTGSAAPTHPAVPNGSKGPAPAAPVREGVASTLLKAPKEGVPDLITDALTLKRAISQLERSTEPTALDTERAQGYRYGGGAYLVQLRKSDVGSFLIDPQALPDLSSMGEALKGTWLLHAADQDLACMADLGLVPDSIFDTEIAAKLLGFTRFSLGAMTEQILGITLEKSHQNEDWSLRPFPVDWLRYAALDVELLPELQWEMSGRIEDAGRTEWAKQEFDYLLTHPLQPREPYWRDLKGLGRVKTQEGLATARELWLARERLGKELDIAPGRILPTRGIVDAALELPRTKGRLTSIESFRRTRARKHTDLWWSAVAKARSLPDAELPPLRVKPEPGHVPAASVWKRQDPVAWSRLQTMRTLASRAADPLGIQPDVVLAPKVQREVAWNPLRRDFEEALSEGGARPWQIQQLVTVASPDLLKNLRRED